jgi:Leucine-rich repeat (LRR) protein
LKENEYLEGDLILECFINLRILDCSFNKLTSLIINDCSKLTKIDCSYNSLIILNFGNLNELVEFNCRSNNLSELNYLSLNYDSLIHLNVIDNNLLDINIEVFNRFINLKNLLIGNDEKFNQIKRNYFSGSTDSIKDINLNGLHIGDIDVISDQYDFDSQ